MIMDMSVYRLVQPLLERKKKGTRYPSECRH